MNDLLKPEALAKRLAESGILTDPHRIHVIEIHASPYNTVTARVEYVLDERFFSPPEPVPTIIVKVDGVLKPGSAEFVQAVAKAVRTARRQGYSL